MQTCPIHHVPMKLLFTSYFCPTCDRGESTPFASLPKDQQRIWFAKDVLFQLEHRKIIPKQGSFLASDNVDDPCEVCALGALTVSCLLQRPGITTRDSLESMDSDRARPFIHEFLAPFFESSQLDLIEAAFERTSDYSLNYYPLQIHQAAMAYSTVESVTERLCMIMYNIIEHHGEFVV